MHLNIVLISVCLCAVHVMGGCAEDPFKIHGFMDKDARDLKDVEMIGKDLKFKLDHGLSEKELMEKTLRAVRHHLLSEYQAAEKGLHHSLKESQVDEKNGFLMKVLHGMMGPNFKKEEISEEELKAVVMFLKSLSKGKDEELFLKKDGMDLHKEIPHTKFDDDLLKRPFYNPEKDRKVFEGKFKDVETHLAESLLHMQTNKDGKAHLYGGEEALEILKKLEEKKRPHLDGSIPYFLMGDEAKTYFKGISESGKHVEDEAKLKLDAEKEALKKLFSLLEASIHQDGALHGDKEVHKDEKNAEGISKSMGSLKTERAVADMKALADHKTHHKEGIITHEKDLIYDELLKKEEVDSSDEDEDIFHEYGKAFEDEKTKALSSEETVKASKSSAEKGTMKTSAKKDEVVKSENDKSIEDILKEDGYYITKGTHAYEKAREKAHEDAKVSLAGEDKKKIAVSEEDHAYDRKFLSGEEGIKKDVYHGVDEKSLSDIDKYLYNTKSAFEGTLKSDASVAHDEDSRKTWKNHEIGSEFAKDKFGIGFGEEHIKHGVKSDESHILHGVHSSDEDLHLFGAKADKEVIDEDKSHNKAHGLKNKFLSVLGKVLNLRKCHLVTMRPGELLGIVDCISRSKDPMLCEKFAMCEKKKPLQVIIAYEKCQTETIPGEMKRCTKFEPLYPSRDIPLKIFKCVVKNTHELSPVEKKQMIDFEECARQVKVESCGRIPWG